METAVALSGTLIDRIVATVNQEVITESDLSTEGYSGEIPTREQLLKKIIDDKMVLQAADREGVRISPAETENALQDLQLRNRFSTREELRQAVVASSLSWERYLFDLKVQMTMMKLVQREVDPDLFVTETEIKSFYESNPKKFQHEQVRIKQILFPILGEVASDIIEATLMYDLRRKADQAKVEIAQGMPFEQFSSDNGTLSELGFFKQGDLSPEINRVVFNLGIGEVSEVVQTASGFHIFKVVDKTGTTVSLESANAEISDFLIKEKRGAQADKWLEHIRNQTVVEIK
jgi:parvulin-like peptidyl-prolyl isomerase